MLQQEEGDDYVIATGVTHSVGELVEVAFGHAGLDWREHVHIDESLQRGRAELHNLVGNATRAQEKLGGRLRQGSRRSSATWSMRISRHSHRELARSMRWRPVRSEERARPSRPMSRHNHRLVDAF